MLVSRCLRPAQQGTSDVCCRRETFGRMPRHIAVKGLLDQQQALPGGGLLGTACLPGSITDGVLRRRARNRYRQVPETQRSTCLLYTSDAADDLLCVDLGGRRI